MNMFLFVCVLFMTGVADAHTRWFAYSSLPPYSTLEPTWLYLTVWGVISAGIVAAGFFLERRKLLQCNWLRPKGDHAFARAAATLSMLSGAFFVLAGTHEYLFSPNLSLESGVPQGIILLQVAVGLAFLVGFYERIAAIVLMLLWGSIFAVSGWVAALEDVWVLTIALFVFAEGNDYFAHRRKNIYPQIATYLQPYSLSILRFGTGLTLTVLGFSEKILHPEFGINFLNQYQWNFMQLLGVDWYSDYLFVLSAGSVEALFGLVFMLGIVTRLNAIVIAGFFSIPIILLGPIELAGHMPHLAAVAILLLFGSGGRLPLINIRQMR